VQPASSSGNVLTESRRTWQEEESSTSDGSDKDVKKNDIDDSGSTRSDD
jgi:hypothetical protein